MGPWLGRKSCKFGGKIAMPPKIRDGQSILNNPVEFALYKRPGMMLAFGHGTEA